MFLFALALAVGLTPELLPVIIAVTLARGAKRMAKQKVIVKQLASIENFGSIEMLCCDKTGTLTVGQVTLEQHVDFQGADSESVLRTIYLNSKFETGMKSPLDEAVLAHEHPTINEFQKIDEVPFDFERRRISVGAHDDATTLISKGAAEDMLEACSTVLVDGKPSPSAHRNKRWPRRPIETSPPTVSACWPSQPEQVERKREYDSKDESRLTLVGFAAFWTRRNRGVAETLKALAADGMSVVIMTGDNEIVSARICARRRASRRPRGDGCADELTRRCLVRGRRTALGHVRARFARLRRTASSRALKRRGSRGGLHGRRHQRRAVAARGGRGISVAGAVDVAKEAADIILLERISRVLHDGIIEGRESLRQRHEVHAHGHELELRKHVQHGGRVAVPAVPADAADPDPAEQPPLRPRADHDSDRQRGCRVCCASPQRWDIAFIRNFMLVIGPISSLYDFLTFFVAARGVPRRRGAVSHGLVRGVAGDADARDLRHPDLRQPIPKQAKQTTRRDRPRHRGHCLRAALHAGRRLLGFTPMPVSLVAIIGAFSATYLALVQVVKTRFYRHHKIIETALITEWRIRSPLLVDSMLSFSEASSLSVPDGWTLPWSL